MSKIKYPVINGKKECGECKAIKPVADFYPYKTYYRSYCKQCAYKKTMAYRGDPRFTEREKGYRKKHYNKPGIREKKLQWTSAYIKSNKEKAVEYKGGKCVVCGYDSCLAALEFHHLDSIEKDKKLNQRGLNRRQSFNKSKAELDKCVLLCCRCHREVHHNGLII